MKFALLLVLALVGCGGGDYGPDDADTVSNTQPVKCSVDPSKCS